MKKGIYNTVRHFLQKKFFATSFAFFWNFICLWTHITHRILYLWYCCSIKYWILNLKSFTKYVKYWKMDSDTRTYHVCKYSFSNVSNETSWSFFYCENVMDMNKLKLWMPSLNFIANLGTSLLKWIFNEFIRQKIISSKYKNNKGWCLIKCNKIFVRW